MQALWFLLLVKERAQDAVILIAGIAGAGEEEQLRGRIGQRVGKGGGCGFDYGGILVRNGNAVGLRGDSRIVGDEVHADAAAPPARRGCPRRRSARRSGG